jgi:hypothetical protein
VTTELDDFGDWADCGCSLADTCDCGCHQDGKPCWVIRHERFLGRGAG